ncbi:MAG: heavy metal sensor histidine kinase [Planctomycetes bacterium]|nr:heavy metal sensor histidine kinase [Planctomycetota bacterium]
MNRTTRPGWSLAVKLTAWYTTASFLLVAAVSLYLYWDLANNLESSVDLFLADQVHVLRKLLKTRPDDAAALEQETHAESEARRYTKVYVRVARLDGAVVSETPGMQTIPPSDFPAAIACDAAPSRGENMNIQQNRRMRAIAALATSGESAAATHSIQIAFDRDHDLEILERHRERLAIILLFAPAICGFVGYQLARRGVAPIADIAKLSSRVRSESLRERIDPTRFPRELAALADDFNAMLDRLAASFDQLSQFSADLAHELRTPVNNLRGEIEVALGRPRTDEEYRETLNSALEESARLARIIDNLLFLARAEAGANSLEIGAVDLAAEIDRALEFYQPMIAESGLECRWERPAAIRASLDRMLFQRAFGNILSNAIRYTPRGGTIDIIINRDGAPGATRPSFSIQIIDNGSGIAEEDLPRVFERFFRADRARRASEGSGLGLAIARGIVEMHAGNIKIESRVGSGTKVTMQFPFDAAGAART